MNGKATAVSHISIGGIDVAVTRKRIKNLNLRIDPSSGAVSLSAPIRASQGSIESFILSRLDWIRKHGGVQRREASPAAENTVMLRGVPVSYAAENGREMDSALESGALIIRCKTPVDEAAVKKAMDAFLRRELAFDAQRLFDKWLPILGEEEPAAIVIRDMKSRWGTCNYAKRRITLNLQLMHRPPASLEYVVIHELCHLKVHGHTPDFWALVASLCPCWKEQRRALSTVY